MKNRPEQTLLLLIAVSSNIYTQIIQSKKKTVWMQRSTQRVNVTDWFFFPDL